MQYGRRCGGQGRSESLQLVIKRTCVHPLVEIEVDVVTQEIHMSISVYKVHAARVVASEGDLGMG